MSRKPATITPVPRTFDPSPHAGTAGVKVPRHGFEQTISITDDQDAAGQASLLAALNQAITGATRVVTED